MRIRGIRVPRHSGGELSPVDPHLADSDKDAAQAQSPPSSQPTATGDDSPIGMNGSTAPTPAQSPDAADLTAADAGNPDAHPESADGGGAMQTPVKDAAQAPSPPSSQPTATEDGSPSGVHGSTAPTPAQSPDAADLTAAGAGNPDAPPEPADGGGAMQTPVTLKMLRRHHPRHPPNPRQWKTAAPAGCMARQPRLQRNHRMRLI